VIRCPYHGQNYNDDGQRVQNIAADRGGDRDAEEGEFNRS
jgi:phenylpropionate dioxygenase-like ring-hydroxylating dioxygenase large terminal subunit